MADMIKFFKGQLANLPEVGTNGALYITTDEGSIYLGTGTGMKRLGDFVQVANVASLPASGANESALYYCAAENILAKWNGSSWSQINKDTGMTAVEVVGDGNAVTAAEYNAETRKLTMTKGATYATPAVVDSKIGTAVGNLGNDAEGNAYANVKAYVDAKTSGIATDAALSELQGKVNIAEGEIDALQEAVAEGGFVANAIAEAKKAGTDAQAAANTAQGEVDALETVVAEYKTANDAAVAAAQAQADKGVSDAAAAHGRADEAYTLASGKATMDQVNDAIANAGHAVKADVDKAIEDMDAAYKKADTDLEAKLQGNIDKKVDQTAYDAKMTELGNKDTELAGLISDMDAAYKQADTDIIARVADLEADITGLSGAMHFKGVVEDMPETTEGYEDGDTIICGNKEFVVHGENFVELGDVSAEVQRISDLEGIVGHAANGDDAATGLVKGVADNAAAIAAEKARAEAKEAELVAADAANLAEAKKHTDDEIAALNIGDYIKKADADAAYATAGHNHDDKYDTIGAAAQALIDAKAYADEAEADALSEAKKYTDELGKTVSANSEAIATKAAKSDLDNAVERIGVNEGKISALETASATHALKTEVEGVQSALDQYKETNNAAVALKANAADVYTKTETYTKAEVEALLTAAQTWGEF